MISFPQRYIIFFPVVICFSLSSQSIFGDSILTQDHKIHQGHIIYEDDSKYVLRNSSGNHTFSAKRVLGVYHSEKPYETDDELLRLYRERSLQISHEDVWERFDLAKFCLESGLYEEAAREFRALVPELAESSRDLEQWIQKAEESGFQAKLNKAVWYSEVGHQENKALAILEALKEEFPEYSARSPLNDILSKVQDRLSQEKFRENMKKIFASWTTPHFRVYAEKSDEARGIGLEAERIRGEISSRLLFEKDLHWENFCEIFVFEKEHDYIQASGLENWSIASSLVSFDQDNHFLPFNIRRYIMMNTENKKIPLKVVLTHEIAHLLVRDRVGLTLHLPPWISEGFAQYFHGPDTASSKPESSFSFETLVQLEKYPPFERAFYEESAGLTRFLMQRGGIEKFLVLAYLVGTDKPLKESLREIYPKDIQEIESLIYQLQGEGSEESTSDS